MTDFRFAEPQWVHLLWVVLAGAAVLAWSERRRAHTLGSLVAPALAAALVQRVPPLRRALAGALLGVSIPTDTFNFVLAGVTALVLIAMVEGPRSVSMNNAVHLPKSRKILGHGLMLLAGFWGGFIQIGMGFILLPILHRALGLDLVTANIHKVFIILIYTTAALFVFGSQLPLLWWVGGIMAIGNAVGGWLGARLTLTGGERVIRIIVVLAVAGMIVKLIWFT